MEKENYEKLVITKLTPMAEPRGMFFTQKLIEELNECGAIASRCLSSGIDGHHPITKAPNKERLLEEMGDVLALITLMSKHFKLDVEGMERRAKDKVRLLTKIADTCLPEQSNPDNKVSV